MTDEVLTAEARRRIEGHAKPDNEYSDAYAAPNELAVPTAHSFSKLESLKSKQLQNELNRHKKFMLDLHHNRVNPPLLRLRNMSMSGSQSSGLLKSNTKVRMSDLQSDHISKLFNI